MLHNLPLYSRGRPLKNLIADWTKQTGNNTILVNPAYDWNSGENPIQGDLSSEFGLYQAVINHWYFSDIGFDSDYIFVKRFNDIYYNNISKYEQLLYETKELGYSYNSKTRTLNITRDGEDTDTEAGNKETVHDKSGTDTFNKGVTTTSNQSTSNTGNKLGRNTPNEQLGVIGSSDTTVRDSGADSTQYGSKDTIVETPNLTKTKKYGSSVHNSDSELVSMLTPDGLDKITKIKSLELQFALLFENLFMGVFN